MKNVLSIDLESWVHFYRDIFGEKNLETSMERKKLDKSYIIFATDDILQLLDRFDVKATFFVLGEIFEWYPEIIYKIFQATHEIGYHTHDHEIVKDRILLEKQLNKSRAFINTFCPKGFRAPQIYLTKESMHLLRDWGFEYSSSTYGPYLRKLCIEGIEEISVSSFTYLGAPSIPITLPRHLTPKMFLKEIPFGSGLFFSLFQSKISYFIEKLVKRDEPTILFVHPWQICPTNEIHNAGVRLRIAFSNLLALPYTICIRDALERVLSRYQFTSFKEYRNGY